MVTTTLDLDRGWQVHPRVAVRPESFGALLYHYGTRRLSFLKDRTLLAVVQNLSDMPTAREACAQVGISDEDLPRYRRALGSLAESQMVIERTI